MMRVRIIALLFFSVLLVPMFMTETVDASPAPLLFVNPYRVTTLPAGTTFDITIEMSDLTGPEIGGGENLYGWGLTLIWDTTNLDFASATEGPILEEGGYSTFWVTPVVYEALGRVDLGCARIGTPPTGAVGSGVLATVTFSVTVEAVTDLQFSLVKLRNDLGASLEPNTGPDDYYFTNFRDGRYGPGIVQDIERMLPVSYSAVVDIFDLATVGINWGKSGVPADVDGSGTVDIDDLISVALHYGYYF